MLTDAGIYQQLATTWFAPPHREISVAVTAKSLGAVGVKGRVVRSLSVQLVRRSSLGGLQQLVRKHSSLVRPQQGVMLTDVEKERDLGLASSPRTRSTSIASGI